MNYIIFILGVFMSVSVNAKTDGACLKFQIETDQKSLALGNEFIVKYKITNTCSSLVNINKNILPGGNLIFKVTAPDGTTTDEPSIDYYTSSWKNPEGMMPLEPGKHITETMKFNLNAKGYREGEFQIKGHMKMYLYLNKDSKTEQILELHSNKITLQQFYKDLFAPIYSHDQVRIKEMIKSGADVNIRNQNQSTPLHEVNDLEIFRILIKSGAKLDSVNSRGLTPFLLQSNNIVLLREFLKLGVDVNQTSRHGETLLHFAAAKGNLDVIKELISHKANQNIKDEKGKTPLQWAKDPRVIELLKNSGSN